MFNNCFRLPLLINVIRSRHSSIEMCTKQRQRQLYNNVHIVVFYLIILHGHACGHGEVCRCTATLTLSLTLSLSLPVTVHTAHTMSINAAVSQQLSITCRIVSLAPAPPPPPVAAAGAGNRLLSWPLLVYTVTAQEPVL